MQIQPTERFGKMLLKLPKNIQKETLDAIENVLNATTTADIAHLKSLKGYPNYYRIRVGQYRMGIYWDGVRFIAEKIATRGDFYKGYPPK